jgi:hypothetical protein
MLNTKEIFCPITTKLIAVCCTRIPLLGYTQ